ANWSCGLSAAGVTAFRKAGGDGVTDPTGDELALGAADGTDDESGVGEGAGGASDGAASVLISLSRPARASATAGGRSFGSSGLAGSTGFVAGSQPPAPGGIN